MFGIDDAVLGMGIGGLFGGISNIFGKSKEEQQNDLIDKYIQQMQDSKAKRVKQAQDEEAKIRRYNQATKHFALNKATQKAAQLGMNAPGTVYASDMAGDSEMYKSLSDTEIARDKDLESIDEKIANMGLSKQPEESGISRFFGGAVSGAKLGGEVGQLLKPNPLKGGGMTGTTGQDLVGKYTPAKVTENPIRDNLGTESITDNPTINPFPKVDANPTLDNTDLGGTGTGQGMEGDGLSKDKDNELTDYYIAQAGLKKEPEESGISRFFGGAVSGAKLGGEVGQLLKPNPLKGDGLSKDLGNALGGKKKQADRGKRLLKFYDPARATFLGNYGNTNKGLVDYYAASSM